MDSGQARPQVGPGRCSWPLTHKHSRTRAQKQHSLKCASISPKMHAVLSNDAAPGMQTLHSAVRVGTLRHLKQQQDFSFFDGDLHSGVPIRHASPKALMVISQSNMCRSARYSPHICDHLRLARRLFIQGAPAQLVSCHV